MLELRRLQALHAVVSSGSVKDAAVLLGYTPSAVSQHLSTLEKETKTVLMEPVGRGVRPTAAGRLLAQHAAVLLERMAETEAALAALNAGETGILRLASFATAGGTLIPPALAGVQAVMPGVEISLQVADRGAALQMLRRDVIDVAVIETHAATGVENSASLAVEPLLVDPFRLALPVGHPLADRRLIPLARAAAEPWIDIRCEIDCCRTQTTAAFERAGFTPRRTVQAEDYWPALGFVAAGLGLALIPTLALGVQHPGVTIGRLEPANEPQRQIMVVTRSAIRDTAPVRAMITSLQGEAQRMTRGA